MISVSQTTEQLNTLDLPYGEPHKGGTWFLVKDSENSLIAIFCCAFCEQMGALNGARSKHTIAADGIVSPGVLCLCGRWNANIRLMDYQKHLNALKQ